MLIYRLVLDESLSIYKEEVGFVFVYLEYCYSIKKLLNGHCDVIISYGKSPSDGCNVHVPSTLFRSCTEVSHDGIHLVNRKPVLESLVAIQNKTSELFYVDGNGVIIFKYDLIAIAFILLSRIEERGSMNLDKHKRYSIESDLMFNAGVYGRPIVDEFMDEFILQAFGGLAEYETNFDIDLTHDVDRLRSYHSVWSSAKMVIGDFVKRKDITLAKNRTLKEFDLREPWQSLNILLTIYSHFNLKATFFLMGSSIDPMDSTYATSMKPLLNKYINILVDNGHNVGLHPGYRTFDNLIEYKNQKESIEKIVGKEINYARQHVLRFNIEKTPAIASAAGITSDCTLAYPEALGFRNGTCRGVKAYDFNNRECIDIMLYSSSIMDFTLHGGKYIDIDENYAFELAISMVNYCKKYRGRLITLYHTGHMLTVYHDFYNLLLKSIYH